MSPDRQELVPIEMFLFQLSVRAQDGGTPTRSTSITVNVNVIRETDTLRFTLNTYSVVIQETENVNQTITSAFASPGVRFTFIICINHDYFCRLQLQHCPILILLTFRIFFK